MWNSLPSNLRTVLGTALLLGIGVAAAAFTLSFFALRDAAENPALKFGQGHAWLFPIGIDMALVFFEVLLLAASMVRVQGAQGEAVQYPRVIPFLLVLVAGAGTLYFNATRVPEQVRPLALAVPVASILVTLGLAYLLKMLATASGEAVIHLAPPSQTPQRIVRRQDTVEGEIYRPDLERAWSASRQTPETGHMLTAGNYGGLPKADAVRLYLGDLTPAQLQSATKSSVVKGLRARGVDVDETWASRILSEVRPSSNGKR